MTVNYSGASNFALEKLRVQRHFEAPLRSSELNESTREERKTKLKVWSCDASRSPLRVVKARERAEVANLVMRCLRVCPLRNEIQTIPALLAAPTNLKFQVQARVLSVYRCKLNCLYTSHQTVLINVRLQLKQNKTNEKPSRIHGGTRESVDRLIRPFKCPGSATRTRASEKPARKRRKVDYTDADGSIENAEEKPWTNEDRLALANRDVNKFPIFKVKDKDTLFRQKFAVPLVNKEALNASRPVSTLGMRTGTLFVAKPLHDPSGKFAIVLYDPTVDEKPVVAPEAKKTKEVQVSEPKMPLMHKSLAEILGLTKEVAEHPKIPVVIDPKLAKVLRPHQVEGVKVRCAM